MLISLHNALMLARFIIAIFWLLIIPGWIFVRLITPRFGYFERLVLSPPASISLIILFAHLTGWLKIRFDFLTVSIFILFLILIFFKKQNFNSHSNKVIPMRQLVKNEKNFTLVVFLPSLVTLLILLIGFHGFIVPTQGMDVVNHTQYIFNIFHDHSLTEAFKDWAVPYKGFSYFYPLGFHSIVALLTHIIPLPISSLCIYTLVILLSFLPLSFYLMVDSIYAEKKLAFLSALCAVTIYLFPYALFGWGGFGLLAGIYFIPSVVAVTYLALIHADRRLSVLSGILIAGQVYTHTTDLLSSFIFLIVLLAFQSPFILKRRREVSVCLSIISIVSILLCLPVWSSIWCIAKKGGIGGGFLDLRAGKYLTGGIVTPWLGGIFPIFSDISKNFAWLGWLLFGINRNFLLAILFIMGFYYALRNRKYLSFLSIQIIFLVIYFISSSTRFMQKIVALTYPWAHPERIAYIQYFFISFFGGLGLKLIWPLLWRRKGALLSIILLLAYCIPSIYNTFNIHKIWSQTQLIGHDEPLVTKDDFQAMVWIKENIPSSETILNLDTIGEWIPDIAHRKVFYPMYQRERFADFKDRQYLVEHIQDIAGNKKAESLLRAYNIRYVFLGATGNYGYKKALINNEYFKIIYNLKDTYVLKYSTIF